MTGEACERWQHEVNGAMQECEIHGRVEEKAMCVHPGFTGIRILRVSQDTGSQTFWKPVLGVANMFGLWAFSKGTQSRYHLTPETHDWVRGVVRSSREIRHEHRTVS